MLLTADLDATVYELLGLCLGGECNLSIDNLTFSEDLSTLLGDGFLREEKLGSCNGRTLCLLLGLSFMFSRAGTVKLEKLASNYSLTLIL